MTNSTPIKAVISAAIAAIGAYLGHIIVPVFVLGVVMVCDYISGVAAAWVHNELSSRVGVIGFVKKLCYLLLVVIGIAVDYVIHLTGAQLGFNLERVFFFGLIVTVWLILNECISILENVDRIGGPVPPFLKKIIEHLKQTTEKQAEKTGGVET